MANDMNIDEINEDIGVDDLAPSKLANQTIHCAPTMQSQSVRKRRPKLGLDLVKKFTDTTIKTLSSDQADWLLKHFSWSLKFFSDQISVVASWSQIYRR